MGKMTAEDYEVLEPIVAVTSHKLARRFRDYTSASDISQEMWAWLLGNKKRYRFAVECEEEEQKLQLKFLEKNLARFGERWCRQEKAKVSGYRWTDEYFYTEATLAALIEVRQNGLASMADKPQDQIKRKRLLNEGNELEAMKADLESALLVLKPEEKALVLRMHGEKLSASELAVELGVSRQAVDSRVKRIMEKMIESLGGPSPYRR